jgi:hypothetical protein
MIRRHYFASYVKYHEDGKGSFSYWYSTMFHVSLFAQSQQVFAASMARAEAKLKDRAGTSVNCIAFSRI